MREIPLHGMKAAGRVALIDDEDYALVARYHWWVWEIPEKNWGPYPQASIGVGSNAPKRYMHQVITGHRLTDHENHDGLDNRRQNLRPASRGENLANQRALRGGSSQYKGVYFRRDTGRWQAAIKVNGLAVSLGSHASDVAAALAYDEAARRAFGKFACPNFPEADEHATAELRRCVICDGLIDPIDFCGKCANVSQKCDEHPRPRRRAEAEVCSVKCGNARRFVPPVAKEETHA